MNKPSNHRVKVLLLLHQLLPGGAPKVVIDALEALQDELDVRVMSIGDGPWRERVGKLFPLFIYRQDPRGSALKKALFWLIRPLRTALWSLAARRWRPDVIYINSASSLVAIDLMNLPDAPVLLHVHETGFLLETMGSQRHQLMKSVPSRYIAVSGSVRDTLTGEYGIRNDDVAVISNFAEKVPTPPARQSDVGRPFVVGGVGMMSWCKGGELWLLVAQELLQLVTDRELKFVWVGVRDDIDGRRFREMARKVGVEDRVEIVGPQSDLSGFYADFDVVAVTSWEESFSLVALEAMSYGKPVACFAGSGGVPEVVGDAGLVIDDFSPRRMAQAIAGLVQSPELAADLGSRARERAENCFAKGRQVALIHDEIRRVARGGGADA